MSAVLVLILGIIVILVILVALVALVIAAVAAVVAIIMAGPYPCAPGEDEGAPMMFTMKDLVCENCHDVFHLSRVPYMTIEDYSKKVM